jgi:Doubled CXXCH motif (Paired_CXXCH_1)
MRWFGFFVVWRRGMKNKKYVCLLLVFTGIILAYNISFNAHEVVHHDSMVDVDDATLCLTCHDGTVSKNILSCSEGSCFLDPDSSQPVSQEDPPDGKQAESVSSFQVNKAVDIELSTGEITCVSCHDLTNDQGFHLVAENKGSRLCTICHENQLALHL